MNSLDHHFQKVKSGPVEYFLCPVNGCEKAFLWKSELERHQITHENSKPYACPYESCEKAFKRFDALRVHYQSHSEEPQFSCSIPGCQAKFKENPALKYHMKKHKKQENHPTSNTKMTQLEDIDFLTEGDLSTRPKKFLFKEGRETWSDCSTRATEKENSSEKNQELTGLKTLCGRLLRENQELKSKFTDQMMSFQDIDQYFDL